MNVHALFIVLFSRLCIRGAKWPRPANARRRTGPVSRPSANNRWRDELVFSPSQSAASSSPPEVLTRNTKLDSTLHMKLQPKTCYRLETDPEICLLWFFATRAVRGGDSH